MLTIGRLGRGQETYYLEKVAHGVEDYYTLSGEPAGEWLGIGAEELGLSGVVEDHDLHEVLLGYNPSNRWALVPGAGDPERRPGFDLTFSAPKGVSLLALVGPEEVRAPALAAHRDAVVQAMDYLERHAAWLRRGAGGRDHIRASGFVAAAFLHRSSRAADPQLHTHVLVANLGHAADGRWSALFGRVLYREARTAGFLYQAALRENLTRALGLDWHPVVRGMAEPTGIEAAVLRSFSSRRVEIEEAMDERGTTSSRSAQVAAYRTRDAKGNLEIDDLPTQWRARAAEIGFDPDRLGAIVGPGRTAGLRLADHEAELLGPMGLTAHASSFDRPAVLRALAERAAGGASVTELEKATDSLLERPELVELSPLPDLPEGRRWSTRELVDLEDRLITRAIERSATTAAPSGALQRALAERPALDDEQRALVQALVATDGVAVVIGPAGTGKTYALDAARAAWQGSGRHVVGVALAGRAAVELSTGAGIPATTLARFLADVEPAGGELPRRSVIVLDEAGMVGTRQLARLFAVAERDRAQLVLVGDHRQLPEIEAGGVLGGLAGRADVLPLSANRRQEDAWERVALAELRAGDVGLAVNAYSANGRITYADTAAGARSAMVTRWFEARSAGARTLMLAVHRSDVEELNARARVALREAGLLGPDELVVGGRRFAAGDEVMSLRNDHQLGLVNGVRARVTGIDRVGLALEIEVAGGPRAAVPRAYLEAGHLGYGYASTIHKAQGLTVDRAFLLGGDALYREAGYVGLSRARQRTEVFLVAGPADPELMHGRSKWEQTDPVGELLWALRQSRAQELAIDGLGRGPERDRLAPEHEPELGRGR
ncbi:MAG TPA: MobF family relaxase [Chloroflexota bacterium]|nr:MobF family relaxase [Chloroflexota bacterium]